MNDELKNVRFRLDQLTCDDSLVVQMAGYTLNKNTMYEVRCPSGNRFKSEGRVWIRQDSEGVCHFAHPQEMAEIIRDWWLELTVEYISETLKRWMRLTGEKYVVPRRRTLEARIWNDVKDDWTCPDGTLAFHVDKSLSYEAELDGWNCTLSRHYCVDEDDIGFVVKYHPILEAMKRLGWIKPKKRQKVE